MRGSSTLITGASRGIGRSIAIKLASPSQNLILLARSTSELNETSEICRKKGAHVQALRIDVSKIEDTNALKDYLEESQTSIDKVVMNAGIGEWKSIDKTSYQEWDDIIKTNLYGCFNIFKAVEDHLIQIGARVVFIGSDSSEFAMKNRSAYCSSKWGLMAFSEVLREELRHRRVLITNLNVSRVDTFFRGMRPGDRPNSLSSDDIADMVSYIFSLPEHIEMRLLRASSIDSSYGE